MSDRFTETIERLLQGEVICHYSQPGLTQYLAQPLHFDEVSQFLRRIGRVVLVTNDELGYYCGYQQPEEHKASIRRQFELVSDKLDGLVSWLRLARMAQNLDRPIVAGDIVKEGELLAEMESSPVLQTQLDDVAHKLNVGRKESTLKVKLSKVFDYLKDNGYLIAISGTGSVYQATAKWSLLYEQMDFVLRFSGIEEPSEESHIQGEMF